MTAKVSRYDDWSRTSKMSSDFRISNAKFAFLKYIIFTIPISFNNTASSYFMALIQSKAVQGKIRCFVFEMYVVDLPSLLQL